MAIAAHPPAAGYRTPRPLRLALVALAALVALVMVAQGTIALLDLAARHTSTETSTYRDVRTLVVDDASDVRLTSAPAGRALEVHARITEGLRSPDRDVSRGGDGELRLSSSCPALFGGSCAVDYDISVPDGTAISVETTAGDVTAENLNASRPISLSTSAGDVDVLGASAPSLRIDTSAGDIDARGVHAGKVAASTSAGDVTLAIDAPFDRVEATTSAGDVHLVVPDAAYRLHTETNAGDIDTSEVRSSPDATRAISAVTSAGDIRIETRR